MSLNQKVQPRPILAIDARMAGSIEHGIAKYVALMAQGLALRNQLKPLTYQPIFLVNENRTTQDFFSFETRPLKAKFLNPSEFFEIPKTLKTMSASLYHSPSFSSLWSCPCPHLITVHDLIHLEFGTPLQKLYYEIFLKRFVKKAAAVLTVSNSSRNELSSWTNLPISQIQVVWNALESEENSMTPQPTLETLGLRSGEYFLCLGNPKPHKNMGLLLDAYQEYRKAFLKVPAQQPWPLVLTLSKTENSVLSEKLTAPGVFAVGKLPTAQANLLLKKAGGLLSPSLSEGFGLPPVEAAAMGVRLAVSDIPPHREGLVELRANEVHWVDAKNLLAWTRAFEILQNSKILPPSEETRHKLRQRLSIQRLGEDMDLIYTSVLGNN